MPWLVLGLLLFLGTHSVSILAPGWREAQVLRLGEKPWKGLYTVASIAGFALRNHGNGSSKLRHPV